ENAATIDVEPLPLCPYATLRARAALAVMGSAHGEARGFVIRGAEHSPRSSRLQGNASRLAHPAQCPPAERVAVQWRDEQPRAARVFGSSDATAGSAAPRPTWLGCCELLPASS